MFIRLSIWLTKRFKKIKKHLFILCIKDMFFNFPALKLILFKTPRLANSDFCEMDS